MKVIIGVLAVLAVMIAGTSCKSTPKPGMPGNRQTYRPLMKHLDRAESKEIEGFKELKKSDPEAYKKRLAELNKKYSSVVKRVKGADGNFTCGCEACQK